MRALRILGTGVGGFCVGLLLLIACLLSIGPLTGSRVLTVMSGSMAPTIHTGDAIVVRKISPVDLRVGDVITFRDPADGKRLITHRLRSLRISGEQAHAVTKGDANTGMERWTIKRDGDVAVVRHQLPKLGFLLHWMRTQPGRLVFVVLPALLLCAFELRRIWRPSAGGPGIGAHAQLRLFD